MTNDQWLHQIVRLSKPQDGFRIGQQAIVADTGDPELALLDVMDQEGVVLRRIEVPYEDLRLA